MSENIIDPDDPNFTFRKDGYRPVEQTPKPDPTKPRRSSGLKPETKGAFRYKRGVLDWTVDELILYKQDGNKPKRIPDQEILTKCGMMGISRINTCQLFNIDPRKFDENPEWREAWEKGRGEVGTRIRASLVNDAIQNDNLTAKIYLDKQLSGEQTETAKVVVNVNTKLEGVSTEELLNITFNEIDDGRENSNDI
jgi:hypothetical protein